MDLKGLGNTGITNSPFSSTTVDEKKGKGMPSVKGYKSTVTNINSNYRVEDRLYSSINELQGLKTRLEDLQNTDLLSNSDALVAYKFKFSSIEYESNFSFKNSDEIKEGSYSVKVQSLSTSYLISSDDMKSDKELGLEGRIEINGAYISIEAEDTLNDIKNKLNYGEDLDADLELDEGEDIDLDGKLLSEKDLDTRSFEQSGKLYIETKAKGEGNSISFEGSSKEILQTLGFINENEEVKNLINEGKNANITVNDNEYTVTDEIEFEGIKMTLDNIRQGEEINFKVESNEDKIFSAVQDFVEKYNEVIDYINNELDTNDREILSIKENLGIEGDSSVGVNVQGNKFYQSMFDLRAALGDPINSSLESAGLIQDNSGKINLDMEALTSNIDELKDYLNEEVIGNLNESLGSYLNDLSIISVKQEASVKTLSEINRSFRSERVMNQIVIENQDSMNFLKSSLELFDINILSETLDKTSAFENANENSAIFSKETGLNKEKNNSSSALDFLG